MSEFTDRKKERIKGLEMLFGGIVKGENLVQLVKTNEKLITSCIPSDVVYLVDQLVLKEIPMEELKRGINKILNLLHKTISDYPYNAPAKDSYLNCLLENNVILDDKLKLVRPKIKEINKQPNAIKLKRELRKQLKEVEKISVYYRIKENVLFPVIERYIPEFRCLKVMWSFHDDIKRNLKAAINALDESVLNLKQFNRLIGDFFFNVYAIKFREERILYPMIEDIIPVKVLDSLFEESMEMGFPFYQPSIIAEITAKTKSENNLVDLETGNLTVDQIKLLFNHLPVDITYVDENNKVKYFSTPKKRIFPRTKAVLGRDVHNCHPPESVHVVEKIVESFRKGQKELASFWINMKGERLLIQYFAIRDENGNYKGVVEVTQEISEIQSLKGENRLLDWEN